MPRKNRIHYRHSFHHVMLRGNSRKNIFYRQDDYESFLKIISEAAETYGFKVTVQPSALDELLRLCDLSLRFF